jgi:alpha-beta hydrolase superfamily lysophospholipase
MKSLSVIFFSLSITSTALAQARICPAPWEGTSSQIVDCQLTTFNIRSSIELTGEPKNITVAIRNGFLRESPDVPFKGNVIYYEGLGDSMLNHGPLFEKLTHAGYRVIAFDYMGQGGSKGSMNDTRIPEIGRLGNAIWKMHARDIQSFPRKTIIGWSTGGLAAYQQTLWDPNLDRVVLIAPGIAPNKLVGEQHPLRGQIDLITLPTLTTQKYDETVQNPHLDPIHPTSPLEVPCFAIDLQKNAILSRKAPLNSKLEGFVLLSGDNDTYVNAEKTRNLFQNIAPDFIIRQYPGTLHEIDNEAAPMGPSARKDILNFLNAF